MLVVLAILPAGGPAAAATLSICYQATVKPPTIEQQRDAIATNIRYSREMADAYYAVAKRYGDDFNQYQVHYLEERSGSLSGDINDYNGVNDTGKETGGATTTRCAAPLVWLVGLKPVAIKGKAIEVAVQRELYSVVPLGALKEGKRPYQLTLAGSGTLLCKDFRREMVFGVEGAPCLDLSAKLRAARKKQ
jgi:hypothetical protein